MSRESPIPLVRCRDCGSPLLQLLDVVGPIDGLSIIMRFCPECERRDAAVAEHAAVMAWRRRDARTARWMAMAADALAAELAHSGATSGERR